MLQSIVEKYCTSIVNLQMYDTFDIIFISFIFNVDSFIKFELFIIFLMINKGAIKLID